MKILSKIALVVGVFALLAFLGAFCMSFWSPFQWHLRNWIYWAIIGVGAICAIYAVYWLIFGRKGEKGATVADVEEFIDRVKGRQ